MRSRSKGILAMLLLIGIGLCGCSHIPAENAGTTEESAENQSETVETVGAGPGAESEESSEENSEAVLETVGEKYPVYKAAVLDVSPDVLIKLFTGGREITSFSEKNSQFYQGKIQYSVDYADGAHLSSECGVLAYYSSIVNNYSWEQFLDENVASTAFPGGVENACPPKDLWFMSYQEAVDLVADYLDQMGVGYEENWTVYPATGEVLTKAQHTWWPDEAYEKHLASGGTPVKRDYSEEEAVYMIQIPLAIAGYESSMDVHCLLDMVFPVMRARAVVGSTGLIYLEIWHGFEIAEVLDNCNIITEKAALELAEQYSAQQLGMKEVTAESRGLCYALEMKDKTRADGGQMSPTWLVEVVAGNGAKAVLYVNGATGEVYRKIK